MSWSRPRVSEIGGVATRPRPKWCCQRRFYDHARGQRGGRLSSSGRGRDAARVPGVQSRRRGRICPSVAGISANNTVGGPWFNFYDAGFAGFPRARIRFPGEAPMSRQTSSHGRAGGGIGSSVRESVVEILPGCVIGRIPCHRFGDFLPRHIQGGVHLRRAVAPPACGPPSACRERPAPPVSDGTLSPPEAIPIGFSRRVGVSSSGSICFWSHSAAAWNRLVSSGNESELPSARLRQSRPGVGSNRRSGSGRTCGRGIVRIRWSVPGRPTNGSRRLGQFILPFDVGIDIPGNHLPGTGARSRRQSAPLDLRGSLIAGNLKRQNRS